MWPPGGPKACRAGGSGQRASALSPTCLLPCRVQLLLAAHHGDPPHPAVLRGAAVPHLHVGDVRDPGALHLHRRDGERPACPPPPPLGLGGDPGPVLLVGGLLAGQTWKPMARPRCAGHIPPFAATLDLHTQVLLLGAGLAGHTRNGPAALVKGSLCHKPFRPPTVVLSVCCSVSGTLLATGTPFQSGHKPGDGGGQRVP